MKRGTARLLSYGLLSLAPLLAWQAPAGRAESLGRVDFPNSGAPHAQTAFIRGVLLLHSFEYEDAREAFREAQRLDPGFALASWGEAMTHNHPLWREQDRAAARAALDRLAPTPEQRLARTPTARERGYLRAVEILYGDGGKPERDQTYSRAMQELSESHPDDLEAKSFYALSILGTAQGVRDFRVYMRAAAVAEEVFTANPEHPGAAHYLIHSYDDPVHAPLGLRAARVYAGIAPAASHAQHMVSHIFVALGRWEDSVESNVKAFEVSARRAELKGLAVDALNYHALHWLQYSYLQLGRRSEALALLERMRGYAEQSRSPRALWHYAAMRAAWVVETRAASIPASLTRDGMSLAATALDRFATGYAAALADDRQTAADAVAQIAASRQAASVDARDPSADLYKDVTSETLAEVEVMETSLSALLALADGRTAEARRLLEAATATEAARPLDYGPPPIVKPSQELYGEVLLRLGAPAAAAAQFQAALERAPRRRLSLEGLSRALEASGDSDSLDRACAELRQILSQADPSAGVPSACAPRPIDAAATGPKPPRPAKACDPAL